MHLKKVILVLIISIIASFSIRITGTLFPQIFQSLAVVKGAILVNTIFILAHLLFWLVFYQEYISVQKPALKKPCIYAVAGSVAVCILYLKKFPLVFDINPQFPPILASPYFDVLVPVISAGFHLAFFVFFKKALNEKEKTDLNKPVISIIFGISIYIVLHLIVMVNFIVAGRFAWAEHMPRGAAVLTVPLIAVAVFLMLFFYYRFYQAVDKLLRLPIRR